MDELIEKLKKSGEELQLITELTLKYKDNKIVSEMLFYKKLEDGILSKLSTANIFQLNMLKNSYKFKYYDEKMTNKLIDIAILKNTRKLKLDNIKNNEK